MNSIIREGPPEKGTARCSRRAEPRTESFPNSYVRSVKSASVDSGCRDRWIERYLIFLEALNAELGGGSVSDHTVRAASKAYSVFCGSCDLFYRLSAWRAISAACQLFAQRKERN